MIMCVGIFADFLFYHTYLITVTFVILFEIRKGDASNFVFLSIALATQKCLFYIFYNISSSVKNDTDILIGIELNL